MNTDDVDRFAQAIVGLAEMFSRDASDRLVDLYWVALKHWERGEFLAAAEHLLRTSQHMPRPFDFERLRRAGDSTAAEAWDRVIEHTKKGAYRNGSGIDDDGPIDRAVRGLGGYRAVAFHDVAYLPMLQREFVARFAEQTNAMDTRAAVPQLVDQNVRPIIRHGDLRRLAPPALPLRGDAK